MSARMPHGQVVESLNLLIESRGQPYELANISFSVGDSSVYVRPVAPTGRYLYGAVTIPAGVPQFTFDMTAQEVCEDPKRVKLSIHESGQAHVNLDVRGSPKGASVASAGPLQMTKLVEMRDKHIATLNVEGFAALPRSERQWTTEGSDIDFAFPFGDAIEGRVLLYVNAYEPCFQDTSYWFEIERDRLERPLYLGIVGTRQAAALTGEPEGVTLLSGWDPNLSEMEAASFLYLRCK